MFESKKKLFFKSSADHQYMEEIVISIKFSDIDINNENGNYIYMCVSVSI